MSWTRPAAAATLLLLLLALLLATVPTASARAHVVEADAGGDDDEQQQQHSLTLAAHEQFASMDDDNDDDDNDDGAFEYAQTASDDALHPQTRVVPKIARLQMNRLGVAINELRARHDLPPLYICPMAQTVAQQSAVHLADLDKLTHFALHGRDPSERLADLGYRARSVTQLVNAGSDEPSVVLGRWTHDTVHKGFLLDPRVRHAGFAFDARSSPATYNFYWTTVLAEPARGWHCRDEFLPHLEKHEVEHMRAEAEQRAVVRANEAAVREAAKHPHPSQLVPPGFRFVPGGYHVNITEKAPPGPHGSDTVTVTWWYEKPRLPVFGYILQYSADGGEWHSMWVRGYRTKVDLAHWEHGVVWRVRMAVKVPYAPGGSHPFGDGGSSGRWMLDWSQTVCFKDALLMKQCITPHQNHTVPAIVANATQPAALNHTDDEEDAKERVKSVAVESSSKGIKYADSPRGLPFDFEKQEHALSKNHHVPMTLRPTPAGNQWSLEDQDVSLPEEERQEHDVPSRFIEAWCANATARAPKANSVAAQVHRFMCFTPEGHSPPPPAPLFGLIAESKRQDYMQRLADALDDFHHLARTTKDENKRRFWHLATYLYNRRMLAVFESPHDTHFPYEALQRCHKEAVRHSHSLLAAHETTPDKAAERGRLLRGIGDAELAARDLIAARKPDAHEEIYQPYPWDAAFHPRSNEVDEDDYEWGPLTLRPMHGLNDGPASHDDQAEQMIRQALGMLKLSRKLAQTTAFVDRVNAEIHYWLTQLKFAFERDADPAPRRQLAALKRIHARVRTLLKSFHAPHRTPEQREADLSRLREFDHAAELLHHELHPTAPLRAHEYTRKGDSLRYRFCHPFEGAKVAPEHHRFAAVLEKALCKGKANENELHLPPGLHDEVAQYVREQHAAVLAHRKHVIDRPNLHTIDEDRDAHPFDASYTALFEHEHTAMPHLGAQTGNGPKGFYDNPIELPPRTPSSHLPGAPITPTDPVPTKKPKKPTPAPTPKPLKFIDGRRAHVKHEKMRG